MFYGKFEVENKMLQAKSRPYSSQRAILNLRIKIEK